MIVNYNAENDQIYLKKTYCSNYNESRAKRILSQIYWTCGLQSFLNRKIQYVLPTHAMYSGLDTDKKNPLVYTPKTDAF